MASQTCVKNSESRQLMCRCGIIFTATRSGHIWHSRKCKELYWHADNRAQIINSFMQLMNDMLESKGYCKYGCSCEKCQPVPVQFRETA